MVDLSQIDTLLPYQKQICTLADQHQVLLIEKSRRIGATWALAAWAVLKASSQKTSGGQNVFYMGPDKDMAREFIATVADWAKSVGEAVSVEEELFKDQDKDILTFNIYFASGFKVQALSSNPRALRGRQGVLIVDEAAFHDDLEQVFKAGLAFLVWGGKVIALSTHNGVDSHFNQLILDVKGGRLDYGHLRINIHDALEQGLYKRICFISGQAWSAKAEEIYLKDLLEKSEGSADEEFLCIPARSGGSFLSLSLIEQAATEVPVVRLERGDEFKMVVPHLREADIRDWCENHLNSLLTALKKEPSFFGFDFARSGDLSVLWVLQVGEKNEKKCSLVLELRNIPFEQQRTLLFYVVDRLPRFMAGKLDATGNGAYLAEVAAQRYGQRIEEVKLSDRWYENHMPRWKAAFEDQEISLPKDRETITDHRAVKVIKGVPKVPKEARSGGKNKRHGDSAVAHVLAFAATQEDIGPVEFMKVGAIKDDYANFVSGGVESW